MKPKFKIIKWIDALGNPKFTAYRKLWIGWGDLDNAEYSSATYSTLYEAEEQIKLYIKQQEPYKVWFYNENGKVSE